MRFFHSADVTACCSVRWAADIVSTVKVTRVRHHTANISRWKLFNLVSFGSQNIVDWQKVICFRKICRRAKLYERTMWDGVENNAKFWRPTAILNKVIFHAKITSDSSISIGMTNLGQLSWKLDLYFLRNHSERNEQESEWTNQPTNSRDHTTFWRRGNTSSNY